MEKTLDFRTFAPNGEWFHIADLCLQPGEASTPHRHDFYEFLVLLQGELQESINGERFLLHGRQTHVVRPDDRHFFSCVSREGPNVLRNIAVKRTVFEKTLEDFGMDDSSRLYRPFPLSDDAFGQFCAKTDRAMQAPLSEQSRRFLLQNVLGDILISGGLQAEPEEEIPAWLRAACREMAEGQNASEGLPRLTALAGVSQEHLTRCMKRYYHTTPSAFINGLRLREAAARLRTTDEKIIAVAYECGYNSMPYFNRRFRALFGMTPREYRERNRQIF